MRLSLPTTPAELIESLRQATRAHPLERKLLVASRPALGRQLLEWLARSGTPWIGWEATSPRQLALALAGAELAARGLSLADEFDVQALVDDAIDAVRGAGRAGPFAGEDGGAYREALHRTLRALRDEGLPANALRARAGGKPKLVALAGMLEEYERRLATAKRVDGAGVLVEACRVLATGAPAAETGRIYHVPGQRPFGLAGRFLRLLVERAGAELLAADPVVGREAPDALLWREADAPESPFSRLHAEPDRMFRARNVALFAAATPTEELREVLRRVIAAGAAWDEVEIIAADAQVYGAALDSLARALSVPVTYGAGLDVGRTRVGRAVADYLEWIAGGFRDHVLWSMLSGGELAPPSEDVSGTGLARALRRLRVGWDRGAYLPAIDRELRYLAAKRTEGEDQDPEETAAQRAHSLRELQALRTLVSALLDATPVLPGPGSPEPARCAPADVARGLLALIEHVPTGDAAENAARDVLGQRLRRIETTLRRPTSWQGAVAVVQGHLRTRTSPAAGEAHPSGWTPAGGRLHLADFESGGLSGRRYTFVVGLTAAATSAVALDPLLQDGEWLQVLDPGAGTPPRSLARLQAGRHQLGALLARLRGRVTLSYCAWDPTEGRVIAPAAELLQVYRHRYANSARTYRQLERALARLACRVPDRHCADETDVWLAALAGERRGAFRRGEAAVAGANPFLSAGLRARAARALPEVNEYTGKIGSRPELNPLLKPKLVLSASRLEKLGACPGHYFYQYVLGVTPTEDVEWDPQTWLSAMHRGRLLHDVFKNTLERARAAAVSLEAAVLEPVARAALEEALRSKREEVPIPSEAVFAAETRELEADVGAFLHMVERTRPDWVKLEYGFGPEDKRPVTIPVTGGQLQVRGRIDRIDRLPGGGLRVVDYKTGPSGRYRERAPFAGGRRVQHVIYAAAAAAHLDAPVEVAEYHFPTRRGENRVVSYTVSPADARRVLDALVAIITNGNFVGSDDGADCRYCDFAAACRARFDAWDNPTGGPPARIKEMDRLVKAQRLPALPPEYEALLALRSEA